MKRLLAPHQLAKLIFSQVADILPVAPQLVDLAWTHHGGWCYIVTVTMKPQWLYSATVESYGVTTLSMIGLFATLGITE
jgi:hypothetical protein